MYVELAMNLHVHGVSLDQLHNLLHLRVLLGTATLLICVNLLECDLIDCFVGCLQWSNICTLSSDASTCLRLSEFTLFIQRIEYSLVHYLIGYAEVAPEDRGSIVARALFSLH